jgi:phage FluMu protein Com
MATAHKQRITCASCEKLFIITTQLTKVKCPNCGAINQLVSDSSTPNTNPIAVSKEPVPQYTTEEVSRIAKGLIDEYVTHWNEVLIPHVDNIENCYKKVYGYDRDKQNEVFVTKAKAHINAPMNVVLNVYWNGETDWDSPTVSMIKYIEDHGNNRLILKEHKTTSAATLRNDLVVRSIYEEYADHIWCYAVSEICPTVPEKGGWRRGHLVLSGFLILAQDHKCEVIFINCFDFGGWIHVKFIDEEQKKVGMRLSRIKKKAEEDYKIEISRSAPPVSPYQRVNAGTPQNTDLINYSPSAVCNICPTCQTISTAKFCSNDGTRLELACSQCYAPIQGTKFCSGCGSKLVV